MPINVGKVAMIPIDSISIGERAREEMGDLDGLETDMKQSGLITPLAVKQNKDNTYTLLAGERRFTVLKRNEVIQVPVRIYTKDLTELEMKVIEKSENFHRKDMEYWELDALTSEIHKMQQELHGIKSPGPNQDGWSTGDTGDLVGGISKGAVSTSIKRAEARDAFPELFDGCKTASDASKVLKNLDEAMVKQTIVQKLSQQKTNSTFNQIAKCFIVRDFFEGSKEIPDEVMHLVEIDPPYAIDLKHQKKKETISQYQMEDYNEIKSSEYIDFMSKVFTTSYRVMAPHSWLICWYAPEPWQEIIYDLIIKAGFKTTKMNAIWTKGAGQNNNPSIRLTNSYESFYYAWKGQPALNKAGRSNEFKSSPVPPNQKTHPTERPVDLIKDIYNTFCFSGSRILIPFLGSGSGLIAAHELGMSPVGFELSKNYKDSFLVRAHNMFNE